MSEPKTFTHEELVEAARKWLWRKCPVVITEMATTGEEADAIGWWNGCSVLVECKASIADFKADSQKIFRANQWMGIGRRRYYCAPKGMIKPDMLPENWGLLEWDGTKMFVTVVAETQKEHNINHEVDILLSALRRTGAAAPSGVSMKCYTIQTKCRTTLSVQVEEEIL